MRTDNQNLFYSLREKHPIFTYYGFDFQIDENGTLNYSFDFRIGDTYRFEPLMQLQPGNYCRRNIDDNLLKGLIFHIGMIELISYWKCVCSPVIHIRNYKLNEEQQAFWLKLFHKGLGEFFYQNGIDTHDIPFITFSFDDNAIAIDNFEYQQIATSDRIIVPIGGGKDSVVTLEKLRIKNEVVPFIINPREATLACSATAGFHGKNEIIILNREIDPQLLELNRQGFLNGHTPFSAMLAFHSLLAAYTTDIREIALSNESSANEPTIPGTDINHQYSKSLEFEQDFRAYVASNMSNVAHYYSYLRPYNELQIAAMFANYPDYFPIFRSCNAGSKENRWCCNCPKCLFTAIILAPYISEEQLIAIFGEDLLDKPSLLPYFRELTGIAENKPFECVGTVEEVNKAINMVIDKYKDKYLIKKYIDEK
ncbi:hypothetical protein LJC68_01395 [Bacteroidales bacterium OttesenSCG-928-B11]|nr:hypothetical protein [Bacteroidales bacterium OttesenSCG-928-E04]MDL2308218.1 hypothetical protein [Bacteroidales bacterium OttesenSCG-928-C03]MDL2311518.1 hypothetical protein [Bacteroidales bacterium OttesenSCG-928-B11]MDL2325657.1 hypothetical protein [Bacteroidales bacterium OttesenSCG-928-A14]